MRCCGSFLYKILNWIAISNDPHKLKSEKRKLAHLNGTDLGVQITL